jgi:putative oxidoreductase
MEKESRLKYGSAIFIRLAVGLTFLTQGVLKYLDPHMGVIRFTRIGFPVPSFTAHLVDTSEIVCGLLVSTGLFTRLASIPLLIVTHMAIATTKIPELGRSDQGFWFMVSDARTDFAMTMCLLFLVSFWGRDLVAGRQASGKEAMGKSASNRPCLSGKDGLNESSTCLPRLSSHAFVLIREVRKAASQAGFLYDVRLRPWAAVPSIANRPMPVRLSVLRTQSGQPRQRHLDGEHSRGGASTGETRGRGSERAVRRSVAFGSHSKGRFRSPR